MKQCPRCKSIHSGPRRICNPCSAYVARIWRKNNREKARAAVRKYQQLNPEIIAKNSRKQSLKSNYGITLEMYDELVIKQSGICAVCSTDKFEGPGKRLMVDHNHSTKQIRGLVCCHCNFLIGHSRENPDVLMKAAAYLNKHQKNGG